MILDHHPQTILYHPIYRERFKSVQVLCLWCTEGAFACNESFLSPCKKEKPFLPGFFMVIIVRSVSRMAKPKKIICQNDIYHFTLFQRSFIILSGKKQFLDRY
jgi:hypothetical protein